MKDKFEVFRIKSNHSVHYMNGEVYLVTAASMDSLPVIENLGTVEANNEASAVVHAFGAGLKAGPPA